MYSFLIYLETLIFMTFFILYRTFVNFLKIGRNFLRVVGDSAEWYARRRVHWWQFGKVTRYIEEEFGARARKSKGGPDYD